jgi:hypothetical protein
VSGIGPKLTDAELVTLAVLQALLGFTSETQWPRHARVHLRHLFPTCPASPVTTSGCWTHGQRRAAAGVGLRNEGGAAAFQY